MSEGQVKKFMYVNRKAPHGTVYALESLEVVLIAAAFDQDVSLAFMDDGVYQLKKGFNTKSIEVKNFQPTYRALDDYDVNQALRRKGGPGSARPDGRGHGRARRDHKPRRNRQVDGNPGRYPELLKGKLMLHIVNKSPLDRPSLDTCLATAQPGGALLRYRGRRLRRD